MPSASLKTLLRELSKEPRAAKSRYAFWWIVILVGTLYLGYFADRTQSAPLFSALALLFLAYFFLCRLAKTGFSIKGLLLLAVVVRVALLFSTPTLSDDVFRFLWDGRLAATGINPFAFTPREIVMGSGPNGFVPSGQLYHLLNSPDYHTIYPPVCQAVFAFAGAFFPKNIVPGIVVIRLAILAAEFRTLVLLKRLLAHYQLPCWLIVLYALNPLIIIELTGNLHFEAVMIAFLLEALWRWHRSQIKLSALFFGFAVATKLLPLIFLPLLLRRLPFKQLTAYYGIVFAGTVLLLAPLLSEAFLAGFSESFSLYFQTFEFNASIYYIVRQIGYWVTGYNIIAFAGKLMAALTFCSIMAYALLAGKKDARIENNMLWVWFLYLLFALTVHPWYITPLIAFCLFTPFRFPLVWSGLAFVTYAGYSADGYTEALGLVAAEYLIVFAVAIYEIARFRRLKSPSHPQGGIDAKAEKRNIQEKAD